MDGRLDIAPTTGGIGNRGPGKLQVYCVQVKLIWCLTLLPAPDEPEKLRGATGFHGMSYVSTGEEVLLFQERLYLPDITLDFAAWVPVKLSGKSKAKVHSLTECMLPRYLYTP